MFGEIHVKCHISWIFDDRIAKYLHCVWRVLFASYAAAASCMVLTSGFCSQQGLQGCNRILWLSRVELDRSQATPGTRIVRVRRPRSSGKPEWPLSVCFSFNQAGAVLCRAPG